MTLSELNRDLEKAKKQLKSAVGEDETKFAQKKIDRLEGAIHALGEKGHEEKKSSVSTSKKKSAKKAKPGKKVMIHFKGKDYVKDSAEYCDAVKKDIDARRSALKNKKPSNKSVSTKVADHVATGILGAIKNIDADKIAANPKKYIAKLTHVNKETAKFVTKLKDIMGSDYSAADMKRPLSAINTAIERIKAKYKKK